MSEKNSGDPLSPRVEKYYNEKVSCGSCSSQSWAIDKLNFSFREGAQPKVTVEALCRKCGKADVRVLNHQVLADYIFSD